MTELRRFSADCLSNAVGIEHLVGLDKLERLAVGIYSLESFDFLKEIPEQAGKGDLKGGKFVFE